MNEYTEFLKKAIEEAESGRRYASDGSYFNANPNDTTDDVLKKSLERKYDIGSRQAKNIVKAIRDMQSKGYDIDTISKMIQDNSWTDPKVSGKDITLEAVNDWVKQNIENTDTAVQRDNDFYSMLGGYEQRVTDSLMLSPQSQLAQQYKSDMYGAINEYEAASNASLAAAEMDAYALLGQQQLELENTIAEQRMKALKSGTTSAQLASQNLANLFAAQSGAAQIANQMQQSRINNANQFAQSRMGVTSDMYSMINSNQNTYANVLAQLGAVGGSYASTVNQPYSQYAAFNNMSKKQKEEMLGG